MGQLFNNKNQSKWTFFSSFLLKYLKLSWILDPHRFFDEKFDLYAINEQIKLMGQWFNN